MIPTLSSKKNLNTFGYIVFGVNFFFDWAEKCTSHQCSEDQFRLYTVVDRVYKKRSAEYTITNITLGSALNSWFE